MMACNNIFGYDPVGAPTCLRKQEVGKPSPNAAHAYVNRRWENPARTQHNPMLRQRVVFMMTLPGLSNWGKAGPLGSVPTQLVAQW